VAVFAKVTEAFVAELDMATEAHLDWTRRVLRCAVLRTPPGEDVMAADAHVRCRFGRWFGEQRERFEERDAAAAGRVAQNHRRMHDAVRRLCTAILDHGRGDATDLAIFERTQTDLVADLAQLKTDVLARSARHDVLTGLPLRHGLEDEFHRCLSAARRHAAELVVVLLDVDHFKQVNDRHGHAVGDLALQHVAALLMAQSRAGEPLLRFGGEEFLALLAASEPGGAEQAVERMLQTLRNTPLRLPDGSRLDLRVSAGLARVGPDETLDGALARADRALYAAKAAGRDRWRWAA
jgi:diguanylate cyclase (GGDEF)-like protein